MRLFVPIFIALFFAIALPATAQEQRSRPQDFQVQHRGVVPFRGGTFMPANLLSMMNQSGKEKLLITFYRVAGAKPNFQRWSYMTDKTGKAADYDRSVVALNEQVRLQTLYENTDPASFLVIHAPLDVSRYSAAQETLFLPPFAQGNSLRQTVFGEKMAIIIPELLQFQALHMSNENAGPFYRAITEEGNNDRIAAPVIAEIVAKPRRAIFRKMSRVGKDDHYMFTLDLAQLTIWKSANDTNTELRLPLWTWRADWYKPDADNPQLLQLYKAIN